MTTPQSYRTLGLTVPISELLDAQMWRERYAWGLMSSPPPKDDLAARICRKAKTTQASAQKDCNDVTDQVPDEVIRWHLRVALSELEVKLGLPMGVVVYKSLPLDDGVVLGRDFDKLWPRQSFTWSEQLAWYRLQVPAPILSVQRIRLFWFDLPMWVIGAENGTESVIKVTDPKVGEIHLMPNSLASLIITSPILNGASYGVVPILGTNSPIPDAWGIDFTAGPINQYGQPGEIEAVCAHWVYARAARALLSMQGAARSKGVTSSSLSIDGLSKSVTLQASGVNGLYAALEESWRKINEEIDWKKLKTYKQGIRVVSYGF